MDNNNYQRKVVDVNGYKVMSYSIGSGDNVLLILHGGPGVPSNYLRDTHRVFSNQGYRVVIWDQLGCGESDKPDDDSLWTVSRFVEEVEIVRHSLQLGKVNILGQSWGGVLGLEYCLKYQSNVNTFIATNTSFNIPLMQQGFINYKKSLGEDIFKMMLEHESKGSTEHPEYQAVLQKLIRKHICRKEIWSKSLSYSMNNVAKNVMSKIFGTELFNCTGELRDYDRTNQLHTIKIPVFLLQGEHDYVSPECAILANKNLPNSELAIIKDSSHKLFEEVPQVYQELLIDFLDKHNKIQEERLSYVSAF